MSELTLELLDVKKVDSNKDKINDTYFGEGGIIPRFGTSTLIIGKTKSGKTTLLSHMFNTNGMYKNFFDEIFCISSTGDSDDVMKSIMKDQPPENTFTDVMEGIEHIYKIMKINKALISGIGENEGPKICVLFDDFINETALQKHKAFKLLLIASRHYNVSVFALSQDFKSIKKVCRDNAINIIFFTGNAENTYMVAENYCPPKYSNKQFANVINKVFDKKYNFLYIKRDEPFETRYRKNFKQIINLAYN